MANHYGTCPFCGGDRLNKAGYAYQKNGRKQKYMCRTCFRITLQPIRQLQLSIKDQDKDS